MNPARMRELQNASATTSRHAQLSLTQYSTQMLRNSQVGRGKLRGLQPQVTRQMSHMQPKPMQQLGHIQPKVMKQLNYARPQVTQQMRHMISYASHQARASQQRTAQASQQRRQVQEQGR